MKRYVLDQQAGALGTAQCEVPVESTTGHEGAGEQEGREVGPEKDSEEERGRKRRC